MFEMQKDVLEIPSLLSGFDHVVVASGARYRWGTGSIINAALQSGLVKRGFLKRIAENKAVRNYFYTRLRAGRSDDIRSIQNGSLSIELIGDALKPGRSEEAIRSAYEAAYGVKIAVKEKVVRP